MKKTFLIICILLLLPSCGSSKAPSGSNGTQGTPTAGPTAASESKSKYKAADFFAFTGDVHKAFKGTGNEYASFDTYVDYLNGNLVQERTSNGGTVSVVVYKLSDGSIKKVFSKGETYYKYDYTGETNMDEVIIKEPIEVGTIWNLADGSLRGITAVDKKTGTEFGIYSAVEVTTKKGDTKTIDYYAKDIGHVKSISITGSNKNEIISVLSNIYPGKPYKQNINFYYPEFSKERVVYLEKGIETKTNDDMRLILERELRTIPQGDKLSKVLSPNAGILGIKLDDSKNTVSVDFSSQLIKDMNAGSSFEALILKCITDTFGTYYQKDNVIITVEGKPYESGHYMMKAGESFKVDKEGIAEFKG